MAILELGVELKNLQTAHQEAKSFQETLKGISSIKVDFKGLQVANDKSGISKMREETEKARQEAIKATVALREMIALANQGNADFLVKLKGAGIEAKTALIEASKAGKDLDNQNKSTRNSITAITLETKKYALEQKKLRDDSKSSSQLGHYAKLSKELNEMRKEAKDLGAQMILLERAGLKSGVVYNTLENKFSEASKGVVLLDNSVKKLDSSLGQNQRNVGHYQQAMRGANGVSMEFARIIQDAPFGMMGIGNNIQQLTQNWQSYTQQAKAAAQANGTVITNGTLLRGVLQNMITPAGLLTLGVSAVTSAWTAYTMWSRKANKATKEQGETIKDLVSNLKEQLGVLSQVNATYQGDSAGEISKLSSLFKITQDLTYSTTQRGNALKELQRIYPETFNQYDIESIKSRRALIDSEKLTKSIMTRAKAKGLEDELAKQYKSQFDISEVLKKEQKELGKLTGETIDFSNVGELTQFQRSKDPFSLGSIWDSIFGTDDVSKKQGIVDKLSKELNLTENKIKSLLDAITSVYGEMGVGDDDGDNDDGNTHLKEQYDYLTKIREILEKGSDSLALFGLTGLRKDLADLKIEFRDINQELDALETKLKNDKNVKNKPEIELALKGAKDITGELEGKRRAETLDKWQREYLRLVEEFEIKYGFIKERSREKDTQNLIDKLKKDGDALRDAGATEWDVIGKITRWASSGMYDINQYWDNIDLEKWGAMNDKLADLMDKPFRSTNNDSLKKELDRRIYDLTDVYRKLMVAMGKPFDQKELDGMIEKLKVESDLSFNENILREFNDILKTNFTSLLEGFRGISWSFESAMGLFANQANGLIEGLNNKNMESALDNLTKVWSGAKDELGQPIKIDEVKLGSAIGSVMGNVIQGASYGSVGGQAVGGAFSGASAGASAWSAMGMAGPLGGIVGAGLGIISGIIGGSRQKKEIEQRNKQIEEAKKTNILLERLNALTYASQIIGSRTEYGLVSGVNRNEFGQIVLRVNGNDLIGVFDRTTLAYGR